MPQNINFSRNMCLIKAVGIINTYAHNITYEIFTERFREIVVKLTMRNNVFVIESIVPASEIAMPSGGCSRYLQLA
jgi:hypothetical protein